MLIVTEHLVKVANNLEHKICKLDVNIEQINKVISNITLLKSQQVDRTNRNCGQSLENDTVDVELIKCRDRLFDLRKKLLELTEVIYISLNYYIKWDEKNASYCYEDALIYEERIR